MTESAPMRIAAPANAQYPEKPHPGISSSVKNISNHHIVPEWTTNVRNPLNWSSMRQWSIIVVLAMTNFVAYVVHLVSL